MNGGVDEMPPLSGGGFKNVSPKSQKQGFELFRKLGSLCVIQSHMLSKVHAEAGMGVRQHVLRF